MDFFSLLTDPKILLIIAALILIIALGVYVWRQSNLIGELKLKNDKILNQVKHGLILEEKEDQEPSARIRHDVQSNMSEETEHEPEAAEEGEGEDGEWDETHHDEEHNAYIQELIRLQDNKRSAKDEYYIEEQQQKGHSGPVYDSEEENVVFNNYESDDDVSESELMKLAAEELASAYVSSEPVIPQVVGVVSEHVSSEKPAPLEASAEVVDATPVKKPRLGRQPKAKSEATPAPVSVPSVEAASQVSVAPIPIKTKPMITKKI